MQALAIQYLLGLLLNFLALCLEEGKLPNMIHLVFSYIWKHYRCLCNMLLLKPTQDSVTFDSQTNKVCQSLRPYLKKKKLNFIIEPCMLISKMKSSASVAKL